MTDPGADTLPAASKARTVTVYEVLGLSPPSDWQVEVVVATRTPLRYTRYPATPTLSVDAFQHTWNDDRVIRLAFRPDGAVGACVSGAWGVALTAADQAEALPSGSRLRTEKS